MAEDSNRKARDALLGVVTILRGLLAAAEHQETMTRYQVGEVLRSLTSSPDRYGTQAIERAAIELGMHPRVLYRYVAVADAWSKADLTRLLEKTNRFGQPISWSHLVALVRIPSPSTRRALTEKCVENAWSVRDLNAEIDLITSRPIDRAEAGGPVRSALQEGIQTAHRAAADLRTVSRALAERLDDPGALLDDDLLARALETFEDLRHNAAAMLEQLEAAKGSVTRLRVAGLRVPGKSAEPVLEEEEEPEAHAARPRTR